ncbi:hypothetical protein JXA34_02055 [Patescibacteria group bacterium]|nr:hypothetical protein [Patescibacteria group bacterium]
MRDKQFVINSIKMDLHRVVNAAGDITKPMPKQSIKEFLNHALDNFNKIEPTNLEKALKTQLAALSTKVDTPMDPHKRLLWTEDVMTVRCRL